MAQFNAMNEWSFSGVIFYLKEFKTGYGASLKIRGESARCDGSFGTYIVELPCLVTKDAWKIAKKKGVAVKKQITLSGHMESFSNGSSESPKTMFIAEYIMEVE